MSQPVEVSVKTQLRKITADLDAINKASVAAMDALKRVGESTDDTVTKSMKNAQASIVGVSGMMKRVLSGLKDDFKTLVSVGSLAGGLKLSSTMKGTLSDTVALSDAVRKLSTVFKIATGDQAKFVGSLTQNLGRVGLGSTAAVNALQGLSTTQVRGQSNLIEYSKTAGMLASTSNQGGQEGTIASGLAGVVRSRGGNVNDVKQMQMVAEAVNRAHEATGGSVTDILGNMESIFTDMNDNFKRQMTPSSIAQLTAISAGGGKGGAGFIQSYLSQNSQLRAGLDAMGFGKLFSAKGGLNEGALKGVIGRGKGMGLNGDVIAGLTNMGLSEDQAKGLKMLYDQLDSVDKAAKEVATSTKTVAESFQQTKTLAEAFKGNFDRVKGVFATPLSRVAGGATDILKDTQKSLGGSLAVVGGSALMAGLLTKIGLGGIGSALGIKNAQERVLENNGRTIQLVHVTNFSEVGGKLGGSLLGGAASSVLPGAAVVAGTVAAGGLVAGAGIAGYAGGKLAGEELNKIPAISRMTDAIAKAIVDALNGMGKGDNQMRGNRVPNFQVWIDGKPHGLKNVTSNNGGPSNSGVR